MKGLPAVDEKPKHVSADDLGDRYTNDLGRQFTHYFWLLAFEADFHSVEKQSDMMKPTMYSVLFL